MTNLRQEDLDALSELLTIQDAKGRVAISIGLVVTVYFENPCTRPMREAITALGDRYRADFHDQLVWGNNRDGTKILELKGKRVPLLSAWLPEHEDGKAWEFGLHGASNADGASPFQVDGLGIARRKEDLGYFRMHLPLRWLADHPRQFPAIVLDICKRLHPLSGYAGIGFQVPMTYEGMNASAPLVAPLASRFPGVEVDDAGGTKIDLQNSRGIKGVNWLTILHDRYLPELGGLDYLRIRLPESTFPFYKYDGGLIIQAGPFPEVGDTTQNRWPRHYVTLAKVLKKIQVQTLSGLYTKAGLNPAAATAWIHRFDDK